MNKIYKGALAAALCISLQSVNAQATRFNTDPDNDFKTAKELYQKGMYSLAYPLFKTLAEKPGEESGIPETINLESRYYSIVCALRLNDATAETNAKEFINLEYNASRIQMMAFHLAEFYYRQKNFSEALAYYEKSNVANLNNAEINRMKFHQGYAYFTAQRFEEAKPLLNAVRQIQGDENYMDANYYYGFILMNEKNYNEALKSFKIVEKEAEYSGIVPYYITQIYYFTGKKDEAIKEGEAALSMANQYYDLQLRQLVGHAYFEKKDYAKALPYLEQYVNSNDKVRREDLYELSYSYYSVNRLNEAIKGFKQLGGKEDSLAQNSMYLLGDTYLKMGDKVNARTAFQFCADNSSNAVQKEVSRFNYGKLSYELGYDDIALQTLRNFITDYPSSTYGTEAKELLVAAMANTNNYSEALSLYNSLNGKSENVKRVYPKILYGRAVELINDNKIDEAEALVIELYNAPYNNVQLPYANFWRGELAYKKRNYDDAIIYLEKYLAAPQTNNEVNTANARYSLGYAYLKKESYKSALQNFDQVTKSVNGSSTNIQHDAYVRGADAMFMNKSYRDALNRYDVVYNNNYAAADYALYQKAVIAGANNKSSEKVSLLESLPNKFPNSPLAAEATMEVANTFMANENFKDAKPNLTKIINNKNLRALHPEAYLKLGISQFNLNENNDALNSFKTLVSKYPNSPESDDAIEYVRSIFIENNQPGEYVSFMKQNGKNVSFTEQDSLTFAAAQIQYGNRNMSEALNAFENYLSEFANGRYYLEANYYVADIYQNQKNYAKSSVHYENIVAKAPNKFAENSALFAARNYYFEIKDYTKAQQYYTSLKQLSTQADTRLEAMRGLLRVQYKQGDIANAVANAEELLAEKNAATDDKMIANIIIAKNHQNNNNGTEAITAYKKVIALGKSEYAAESRYQIAAITFQNNDLVNAEKLALEVINKAGSYYFWITKSYILLGDIYYAQKDFYNAEATLKSVVDNATDETLKTEAQQKLDKVIADKNAASKVVTE